MLKKIKKIYNQITFILRYYYKVMISYTGHPGQEEHGLVEKTES